MCLIGSILLYFDQYWYSNQLTDSALDLHHRYYDFLSIEHQTELRLHRPLYQR